MEMAVNVVGYEEVLAGIKKIKKFIKNNEFYEDSNDYSRGFHIHGHILCYNEVCYHKHGHSDTKKETLDEIKIFKKWVKDFPEAKSYSFSVEMPEVK